MAYDYDDFGVTRSIGDSTFFNEICYTGAIYDVSTGLYYLNARYYDPKNGRFITMDTYRGEINEPDTQHLYTYCANNPINYVDPSGHAWILAIPIVIKAATVAYKVLSVGVKIGATVYAGIKVGTKIKDEREQRKKFYIAKRGAGGVLVLKNKISKSAAIKKAKSAPLKNKKNGKYSVDIWTPYRKSAADVAKAACEKGANPIREIDKNKPGYFWHYHPRNKKRQRKNSHIFYWAARG